MVPGSGTESEPATAAEADRFASGKLRACRLCRSKKKRCTHRGDPTLVAETVPVMPTRRRKREEDEAPTAKTSPTKSPFSPASTSSITSVNEMEKASGRHTRSVSFKSRKTTYESTAPANATATNPTRDIQPETAASKATITEPPTDMLKGSIAMSVHSIFAQELQQRLDEFETRFEASVAAHEATQEAAQAVRDTVHGWVNAWTSGQ
ncbi:hypothetical protein PENDEC_c004G03985 [Penicillium decumbens]|uniref:Uncharacterized protein n=1 Tax=Penicillium decumbens TaxID=69771 RepID=A0A1V6PIG5_PENDC|nr:hypothetical protein PENDEC_c004G03985 [Penicillium decumbens]